MSRIPFFAAAALLLLILLCAMSCVSTVRMYDPKGATARLLDDPKGANAKILSLNDKQEISLVWVPGIEAWVGKYEITIDQFSSICAYEYIMADFRNEPGYSTEWPVLDVGIQDAIRFCNKMNSYVSASLPQGYTFRPPTSSEWEIIARCGKQQRFAWGDPWPPTPMADGRLPNFNGEDKSPISSDLGMFFGGPDMAYGIYIKGYKDGFPGPCPVQSSGANEWGIYGIAGNVSEWCYANDITRCILKGGNWITTWPKEAEISSNGGLRPWIGLYSGKPRDRYYTTGFRIILGKELNSKKESSKDSNSH